MAGLNKVMLIGHLGRDPEMHYTPDGIPVTSFSLAVKRDWQDSDGENRDILDWFNVVAWRRLAETCNEQLHKGESIYVEGQLQTRTWEDEDGQACFRMEVIASDVVLLCNETAEEAAGKATE